MIPFPQKDHLTTTLEPLHLVVIVVCIASLAWAGSLFFGAPARGFSRSTPTPTRTPTPENLAQETTGRGDYAPILIIPTATPTPQPTPTPPATPRATPPPSPTPAANQPTPWLVDLARAKGLNPAGDYIVVDQDHQKMYLVREGVLERVLEISTGDPARGWDTPRWFGVIGEYWGTFKGQGGVRADEGWWLFKRGGNYLIHGLPYTLDANGAKHYKGWDDLGAAPASRGCIRLAPEDAAWFTAWGPEGVPIIILPYSSDALNSG